MALDESKIPDSVRRVLARLRERGFDTFLVGGCVRDLLRGVTPKDFDVATSARPEQVQRSFARTIPTGIAHGTVTVLSQGTPVEVTTFRSEGAYLDSRRPSSVSFHTDIREDLSRRDFTINAMAFDPADGRLVDPFGGRADLDARLIRCVGRAADRFSEDGLRPLRAVRFSAVLGFALDPDTEAAIPRTLPSFRKVAHERIREEFVKLLLSERPAPGLQVLHRTGLLEVFLPELSACVGCAQDATYPDDVFGHQVNAAARSPPVLEVRLAALLHDLAKPRTAPTFTDHARLGEQVVRDVLVRLRFPSKVTDTVGVLVREHPFHEDARWTEAALRRLIARLGEPLLDAFFAFTEANRAVRTDGAVRVHKVRELRDRTLELLAQKPPLHPRALALNGSQIMKVLGISPSPAVGEATRFLMDLVLEDPSLNTEATLTSRLREWGRQKGLSL